ncbi:TRAP transporter substrate-binding protein DctP [Engelhardtia mirabilis]|uniref:2,3-diketo-L-gulonate-binding periplasmic protein YiaO n=1 Tax=Engelhardtia mirabilis TaxID=2528011 RepID=A0A518BLW2_9BACT|nr:2,3-diketo-L-gulonate-binding periplasmic protein YiaO precursor [Planctomycetes bacterium Pla133]QDV02291.1 2,3-diketo-L-gulonate-binding periplasmic protein YiaO precursor [Planctomycetes bacterium Pla86]
MNATSHVHLPTLAALLLSILVASCGGDSTGGGTQWRLAIEEAPGSVQDAYAQEFARLVAERTDGAVSVTVYPYGALGTSDDITEQLRMGGLQFAMSSPGHLGKSIPELQALLLHFLFTDDEATNRAALADPEIRAAVEPLFPPLGLELMSILPEGWMVWTTKQPVRGPEDFAGIKTRTMTSPLLLATYDAFGANPQAMPYGEVYSALQLDMIDAQVNPLFAIEEMSFYEVTDYLVRAKPAPFLTTFLSNHDFLAGLAPELRATVDGIVADLEPFLAEHQRSVNEERLAEMLAAKPSLTVIELEPAEREAFRELAQPLRDVYLERAGQGGQEVLDALESAIERARG